MSEENTGCLSKWEEWEKENKINFPKSVMLKKFDSHIIIPNSEKWEDFGEFTAYSSLTTSPSMSKKYLRYHQIIFRSTDVLMYESNITGVGQNINELHQEGIQRFKTIIKLAIKDFNIEVSSNENLSRSVTVCPECKSAFY